MIVDGQLVTYVYVDVRGRDIGGYVDEARRAVIAKVDFPPGYATEMVKGRHAPHLR